jgi:hypothetical protein
MSETGRQTHERAEEILAPLLAAQGRDRNSYTSDEYLQACEQAQSEQKPEVEVAPKQLDWATRRQRDDALAGFVMATLEREGGEITAKRYVEEFERLQADVERMRAVDAKEEKEWESLSLKERVARLERRLSSP